MQNNPITAPASAARWVKNAGGSRASQDAAAIYAKELMQHGKSGATALEQGYRAGMRIHNACAATAAH